MGDRIAGWSLALSFACTCIAPDAGAQTYPSRPIRIVVGFQAGGAVDISARAIARELTESIGQTAVVDNRPGAAGNIGAEIVARASPDGYSLLMANSTVAIPSLFPRLPFDVNKDLAAVSLVAIGPSVLVVHPAVPATNLKELLALARARPKQLVYGSGGLGNITHLEMVLLTAMTGIDMVHVPYKGGAPSVIGVIGGEVQTVFTAIPSVLAQIRAGKARAICTSFRKRNAALPEVPTCDEAGATGYDAVSWYGLLAPAGVPKPVLTLLSREVARIMRIASVRDRFTGDGFEPVGNTPDEFAAFIREEIVKWAKVVKAGNIRGE